VKSAKFMQDIQIIYDELQRRQEELGSYMEILHGKENRQASKIIDRFLKLLALPKKPETAMAALTRLINLREDALEQVMKQEGFSQEQILAAKERAYFFVSDFHLERFEELIVWIKESGLLSPFYRAIISGAHAVGLAMTRWQNGWTSHIIHGINRELFEIFEGDEERIFEMLREKKLLDSHKGQEADRCYSVLTWSSEGYRRVSYAEAFAEEILELERALEALLQTLEGLKDDIFDQKGEWIEYFQALKRAFLHTDPDELVAYWADVDRAWMQIKTPIQLGHPLEYYEDHYRKAVALEWDLRIINPHLQDAIKVPNQIRAFGARLAARLGLEAQRIFAKNVDQIERTQLYIGRPMLYYGAEFNGLFSAQVVPNDEEVSKELGKKIFAYADYVWQSQRDKPVMQLSLESLGEEFVRKRRAVLENRELWMRLYEISTIGHEYGHILWIDSQSEVKMNRSGQFKNIEEFKATAGGLMAFFEFEDASLKEEMMDELVNRAVGLMAWREVGEVLPYYCEGLIHLELLYRSGAISFEGIAVSIDYTAYKSMKESYKQAYIELVSHYIRKEDAAKYLKRYAQKIKSCFLPITPEVCDFVEAYYHRYKEIGQRVVLLD